MVGRALFWQNTNSPVLSICRNQETSVILKSIGIVVLALNCFCVAEVDETKRGDKRPFTPVSNGFNANGISYGPFRTGQRPGGNGPTKEQIREDLKILERDQWQMIRTYGTEPFARKVCEVIGEEKLKLKAMIGAWVETEKGKPDKQAANQMQVDRAIKLANEFPGCVVAVSVGNESQVFWSFHKVQQSTLIKYIRQVRNHVKQPVTVADDFKYWTSDESKNVAKEIDFIVTHAYAMWLGQQLDDAIKWTEQQYNAVSKKHPDHVVVIGETGWGTQKANHGEQAKLIKGQPGVKEQARFLAEFLSWAQKRKVPYFYFEAFDEPWKGGDDPAEVEKHWGIYRVDRKPKPAMEMLLKSR